jgi:hypothetical protein
MAIASGELDDVAPTAERLRTSRSLALRALHTASSW